MFAVIVTGGKQYKVSEGEVLKVEKLSGNVGEKIKLSANLIVDNKTLTSDKDLQKYEVEAEVLEQGKGAKIVVFKYKAKKNERKHQGHRQPYTKLKIVSIKKI